MKKPYFVQGPLGRNVSHSNENGQPPVPDEVEDQPPRPAEVEDQPPAPAEVGDQSPRPMDQQIAAKFPKPGDVVDVDLLPTRGYIP